MNLYLETELCDRQIYIDYYEIHPTNVRVYQFQMNNKEFLNGTASSPADCREVSLHLQTT